MKAISKKEKFLTVQMWSFAQRRVTHRLCVCVCVCVCVRERGTGSHHSGVNICQKS